MASRHGPASRDLTWLERLSGDPSTFDFHVALRRFDAAFSDAPRVGEAERTKDEPLRLGQTPSASFEPHLLTDFVAQDKGLPARLLVGFFGLWGPSGPLPGHMTEYARERIRHVGDATLARFADVFHHRMLSLFHRAWAKSRPAVGMDRPETDGFAQHLGALFGLGLSALRNRDAASDFTKLYYAGQWLAGSRNADGLGDIIADHFGVPTSVEEFVGQWVDLPKDSLWMLGVSPDTGTLGRTIVLGKRVFSRTHKFRLVLGPLTGDEFEQMLPNSPAMGTLSALVRFYTNDEWEWDLVLLLDEDSAKPMQLGGAGRLGWTTRIGGARRAKVELVVDPLRKRTRRAHRYPDNTTSAVHPLREDA